jgi:hypothetical protein
MSKTKLASEVELLAADESDREEMHIIREQLGELAPDEVS